MVLVCACLPVCVCAPMCVCECMFVCVCMCVCLFVSVCYLLLAVVWSQAVWVDSGVVVLDLCGLVLMIPLLHGFLYTQTHM